MKIGVFGGTFDPVHWGHLLIAEAARESAGLDQVVFVPAGQPPHKPRPQTPARHRLAMLRLAIQNNSSFSVSDWEIRQNRVVYTVETLTHFQSKWPKASLHFILGADAKKGLSGWREPRRIQSLCRLVSTGRFEPFSSTEIRRRVKTRRSIRYWVTPAVERYIQSHRLYRA